MTETKKSAKKRTVKAKAPSAPARASESPRPQGSVTFRVLNGTPYLVTPPSGFPAMAMYWEYVLRNRIRWAQDKDAAKDVTGRAVEALRKLGLDSSRLSEIAIAGVVQIDIPYTEEAVAWELRVFPWEFLLFSATANERTGPLIVIRHVCCANKDQGPSPPPTRLMVVESAPGKFGQLYSFASERLLVASNLRLNKVLCKQDPTLDDLKASVKAGKPDVIHLSGVDAHQAEQLLKREEQDVVDGYVLADPNGNPAYANPEALAEALLGDGSHRATLVSCNFWNSAARVAALIAARSAAAVIGFQDEIDDKTAEDFFAKFYFNWRALGWDVLRAFRLAVRDIHFDGAVVVLWSARSLIESIEQRPLQQDVLRVGEVRKTASPQDIAQLEAHEVLDLVIKLKDAVNYSLLQNDENLFTEFSIRKLVEGPVRNIEAELMLYVGSDSFPYHTILNTQESYLSLAKNIRFPLTSTLLRSLRESVNSVISIKVTWNGKPLYLDTHPVKLLAIDEWMDTPELDAYLPSFVFPRDRAVARIIDSAQRYLMALNDDSGAGFDGYQGVDTRIKDPFATVDLQARAIWSALSYDSPLSYINPPPSFTTSSQRLRTPSDVMDGKRGTCIDLALLLAACLEYAGIYPVIFLLTDHAFPGYWRSEKARQDFITMRSKPVVAAELSGPAVADATTPTPMKPWVFTNYAEVVQLARNGDIVPIETVWLTQHKGFWDAVDEGMADLRSKREFGSMIDIQGARSYKTPITPLPILGSSS
jgi:hypothetical protein